MKALVAIDRLYERLLNKLYERQDPAQARAIAHTLDDMLSSADESDVGAIFVEECRSLISEARGDLPNAVGHRENEIRLIRRLHEISRNTDSEDFVRGQYDYDDLRDRLNILASLYHESGDVETAIGILKESRQFCLAHGLEFDWDDVLSAYLEETTTNVSYSLSASENGALSVRKIKTVWEENMPTAIPFGLEGQAKQLRRPDRLIPPEKVEMPESAQSWRVEESEAFGTNIIRKGILV